MVFNEIFLLIIRIEIKVLGEWLYGFVSCFGSIDVLICFVILNVSYKEGLFENLD